MAERRTSARQSCDRAAFVHYRDAWGEHWRTATLREVSSGGVRLLLRHALPEGMSVTVEPPDPGGRPPFQGRIVYASAHGRNWIHGCALTQPVGDEVLKDWAGS
jgi:hypothetical protein